MANTNQISTEDIKTTKEFEEISEEEAQQIAHTLSVFCEITYSVWKTQQAYAEVSQNIEEQSLTSEPKVLMLNKSPVIKQAA